MTGEPTLEFWFEFASTYSYPAAMTIAARAQHRGIAVHWRPFLLGMLMTGFAEGLDDLATSILPILTVTVGAACFGFGGLNFAGVVGFMAEV